MYIIKALITTLALIGLLFTSCSESDNSVQANKMDYLIFGHFHGECLGEGCVETFKLTGDKLYEDTLDIYNAENLAFVELSREKFELVKDIIDYFPNKLLNDKDTRFGCPDCRDQGGVFIQYSENGIVKSWRIDKDKDVVPEYLHNFINKVNEKIRLINK